MAMAKRSQSNPWMPAAIIFVFLFIVATIAAIIFYLDSDKKAQAIEDLQSQQEAVFNSRQYNARADLVGTIPVGKNMVEVLLDNINQMTQFILGAPVEDKNAEMKLQDITNKITEFITAMNQQYPDLGSIDVKTIGLLGTLGRIKNKLDASVANVTAIDSELQDTRQRLVQTEQISNDKVKQLQDEKDALTQKALQVQASYDQMKALMDKSTEDQVKVLAEDLAKAREKADAANQELLKTQAEYKVASNMLKDAREKLAKFTGRPDIEPQVQEADGEILMLDETSGIVHLNIGSKEKVYPGLTFGVYDRNVPIPPDGKGKAEVQVFSVDQHISTAKIISSDPRKPIIKGDIVANLVWSKDQSNLFVVAGDFDLDGDGVNDYQAQQKIKALIDTWGGQVQQDVTINTDFIVLGTTPMVLSRPTYDEISIDPLAMDKYEKSLQRLDNYKKVKEQADKLQIPLMNYERFLYLIGYKNQSSKPGAFSD